MKDINKLYDQWHEIDNNLVDACKEELKKCAKELEELGVLEEGIRGFNPDDFNNDEDDYDEYIHEIGLQYTDTDGITYIGLDFQLTPDGEIVFTHYIPITGDGQAEPEDLEEGYDYYSIDYANKARITYELLCDVKSKIERLKESK